MHFNARNEEGETALYAAAEQGRLGLVQMLLLHKADVMARTASGETALHAAAMLADAEIARLLLQHGADKNARNKDGETPLLWAALTGTLEPVRLLVSRDQRLVELTLTVPAAASPDVSPCISLGISPARSADGSASAAPSACHWPAG